MNRVSPLPEASGAGLHGHGVVSPPVQGHLEDLLGKARALSWQALGRRVDFFFPGMFRVDGARGRHRALSITGSACDLKCEHCRGLLLASMIPAPTPAELVRRCVEFCAGGVRSVLVSGGCDRHGRLPWERFEDALREIKETTGLFLSVHAGLADARTARALRRAKVDQVLIDVVGDRETLGEILHLEAGPGDVLHSLEALRDQGLSLVPHVVCGLYRGRIRGERAALEMIASVGAEMLVFCSIMGLPGAPSWNWPCPDPEEAALLIAEARFLLPDVPASLGCARRRGDRRLEKLALDAGVNRMALPGEETVEHAHALGLAVRTADACCSLPGKAAGFC